MTTLISVNVGLPKDVPWQGRTVHTGVWKSAVTGPRLVRRLNIDGDGQGDLAGHGGENRAVLVYQLESYAYWRSQLGRDDLTHGHFGENFTVDGLPDDEVCVGDRYRIGEAEFEVTQPRVTCYRLGLRLDEPDMAALLVAHRRPGFYLRVLAEGRVTAGDEIVRVAVGPERFTIADIDALLYLPGRDPERLRAALRIPALSPGWQASFADLLAAAERGRTGTPTVGVEPGWAGFRRLRVVETVPESTTVLSIRLAADDGQPLPTALPGQYLTLRLADAGRPAPVRSYSLSALTTGGTYRISVKREDRGLVSRYLHTRLRPGTVVEAAAPRGGFVLGGGDAPVLLLSAGVGVTPVLAMLAQLAAEDSPRETWWIHVTRDQASHALGGEAHGLLGGLRHAHERIFYTAGVPGPPGRPAETEDRVVAGRPSQQTLAELGVPPDAVAYLCGPAGFMAAMQAALVNLGLRAENIHTELFGALPGQTPGVVARPAVPPHAPAGPPGAGAAVTFARSGLTVGWPDGGASLLDLADACDVPTRWSCRTGVCHTCVTPLLAGSVRYSPDPLEPPGPGEILICCARPDGEIVLDL